MSRNKHLKFCDLHRISDGLLKEFLFKELYKASLDQIDCTISEYKKKIKALEELKKQITEENKNERTEGFPRIKKS